MADGQPETATDSAIGWFWIGIVFVALMILVWYFYQDQLRNVFRWIRWLEMWIVYPFANDDYTIQWNGYDLNFKEWFNAIPGIHYSELPGQNMAIINTLSMTSLHYVYIGIITLMGIWVYFKGPRTHFLRKPGLDGLIKIQAPNFPVVSPFVDYNPSKNPPRPPGAPVPAELPLFAEALGPEEWLAYNQIPAPDGNLDENALFIALAKQLGPRWQGPMKLAPHKQILLAAFCLKAARKRQEGDKLLGRLATCWSSKKGLQLIKDPKLLSEARKILKNKELSRSVLSKCNQHAFQTTAILRALATAREEGGVLSPGQFVWLRGHDRALWYPLNNLGKQAYHAESLGAMGHYKFEKRTQRPIPKPKMEESVDSIVEYMKSDKARPIPALDYSGSKKRGIKKPTKNKKS